MTIQQTMSNARTLGRLLLDADSDKSGDGVLTILQSKFIVSQGGDVSIMAYDLDLSGSIDSGVGVTEVTATFNGQTIGLGLTARQMHISCDEVQRISSSGLVFFRSETQPIPKPKTQPQPQTPYPNTTFIRFQSRRPNLRTYHCQRVDRFQYKTDNWSCDSLCSF